MALFTVFCHEFKLILRDPGIILFVTFLPLAYPVIYSLIYNPELVKDVPMVVVDSDRTALSRKLTRELDACDQARVIGYAADLPEARRAMDSHQCYAILEIPEGFARKIGNGETGNAVMYCEMSLLLRYRGFLVASTNVMQEMGAELAIEKLNEVAPLAETVVTGDLLPIDNISMGNIRNGFDSFIMPGVLILILHQCIVLALGMAGGAKKENPRLIGYDGVNMKKSTLLSMTGQALCYFTVLALPLIFLIHYVPLIFDFPMAGDFFRELMLMLPMVLGAMGLGFALQAIVNEREEVFVIWVFTSVVLLFTSGLIWPRYDMWPAWKALGAIFPSTWGLEGYVKMNTNGATLSQVRGCYENLWILAAAWWMVGYICQRWVVRRQIARLSSSLS